MTSAQNDHSLRRPTQKLCKAFLTAMRKANRDNPPLRIRHWPDCDCTQTDSVGIVSIWLTWGQGFINQSQFPRVPPFLVSARPHPTVIGLVA